MLFLINIFVLVCIIFFVFLCVKSIYWFFRKRKFILACLQKSKSSYEREKWERRLHKLYIRAIPLIGKTLDRRKTKFKRGTH